MLNTIIDLAEIIADIKLENSKDSILYNLAKEYKL